MITERNVANLLIVRSVAATGVAGKEGTSVATAIPTMVTGESVCTTPGGIIIDASTATVAALPQKFKIGTMLSTGKILWSDLLDAKSIKSVTTKRYAAATLQTDYIGYNGTSGSIEAINNNIYTARLYRLPLDMAGFAQQRVNRGVYKSDSSATQQEIALGVTTNLISNMSKDPEKTKFGTDIIKVERINSGAALNAMASATATVVKGSKYVTLSEDESLTCPAGSIIRLGGTGAGATPCYGVVSISASGLIVTLDQAYQGASETIAHGNVETVTEGNWGIKLTGVKYSFSAPKFGYALPRWKTTLQDFGTTTVTESAISEEGCGMYEWVAQVEQQLQGNEGNFYRAQVPYPTFRSEAVLAGTYAIIEIEYEDNMTTTLGGSAASLKQLWIACAKGNGATYSDAQTGLGTTLNAYATAYPNIATNGVTIATEINA